MKNNAILLCGGIGRRMSPIPRCNKSLLNIRGEMNLHRIIRILVHQGIEDIVIATNPQSAEELTEPLAIIASEFPNAHIITVSAEDYVEGCNNVVTLRAASKYIGNSYIIETDQYYREEVLEEFITDEPMNNTYFFTQNRKEEDWAVVTGDYGQVTSIMCSNPGRNYHCLSGIYYIKKGFVSEKLVENLSNYVGNDVYWEELLVIPEIGSDKAIMEWYCPEGYSVEYDDISDLVNNQLMSPSSIADLIDDNHHAERLSSMTNTTYKVSKDGKLYALRIPGYGTDRFVNHRREKVIEEGVPTSIRPNSQYFSRDEVKLSDYLEGYSILDNLDKLMVVSYHLSTIHNSELYPDSSDHPYIINLMKEIEDYESIYSGIVPNYQDYLYYKDRVKSYLEDWFSRHHYERVHRDLVPQNIMINESGDVKFIDWEYAGYLSRYWDLASLICEYSDEYQVPIDRVLDIVKSVYRFPVERNAIIRWIAIVDFVWSIWSLAKVALSGEFQEYGQKRYNRATMIIDEYMQEDDCEVHI